LEVGRYLATKADDRENVKLIIADTDYATQLGGALGSTRQRALAWGHSLNFIVWAGLLRTQKWCAHATRRIVTLPGARSTAASVAMPI